MSDPTLPRTSRELPRYDATVQRSPKNVFDRDPVLIPQLFVDPPVPRWYRRPAAITLASVSTLAIGAGAVMVSRFGLAGATHRIGSAGSVILEGFVGLVAP